MYLWTENTLHISYLYISKEAVYLESGARNILPTKKSTELEKLNPTHPFSKPLLDFILQRNVFFHLRDVCKFIFAHF